MSETPSNAIFVIAAISVIIFSLVGVGMMTGVIPSSLSKTADPHGVPKTHGSAKLRAQSEGAPPAPARPGCASCGRVEMVSLVDPRDVASRFGTAPPQTAKQPMSAQRYAVLVRLEDGTARTFSYETQPAFRAGDTVEIVDGTLTAN